MARSFRISGQVSYTKNKYKQSYCGLTKKPTFLSHIRGVVWPHRSFFFSFTFDNAERSESVGASLRASSPDPWRALRVGEKKKETPPDPLRLRSINPPRFLFQHARSTISILRENRGCVSRLMLIHDSWGENKMIMRRSRPSARTPLISC